MENTTGILNEHLQILGSGLILLILMLLIFWRTGFFHLPKEAGRTSTPLISTFDLIGAFFIVFSIEIFIAPLISLFWVSFQKGKILDETQLIINPITEGWINIFAIWASAIGIFVYLFSLPAYKRWDLWGKEANTGLKNKIKNFLIGSLTWLLSYPILITWGQVVTIILLFQFGTFHIEQVAVQHLKKTMSAPILFWVTVVSIIFIVPMIEETLFRGFLQGWLKGWLGRTKAIIITALIFSLFHFASSQGIENIELISSLFILGCFLGFLYERQRSLLAPIGLHSTFNAISVLMIMNEA